MVGNRSGHRACGSQPSAAAVARALTAWGSDSPLTQRPTVLTSTPATAASLRSLKPFCLSCAASAWLGTGSLSTCLSYDAGDHAPVVNLCWPRRAASLVVAFECPVCRPVCLFRLADALGMSGLSL